MFLIYRTSKMNFSNRCSHCTNNLSKSFKKLRHPSVEKEFLLTRRLKWSLTLSKRVQAMNSRWNLQVTWMLWRPKSMIWGNKWKQWPVLVQWEAPLAKTKMIRKTNVTISRIDRLSELAEDQQVAWKILIPRLWMDKKEDKDCRLPALRSSGLLSSV